MPRHPTERILLIGDHDREMQAALEGAAPGATVMSVNNYFEGIAELVGNSYTTVLAAAEPIERRPEAAVKTLRQLAGDGRVLLFGHPTLEPLSRKMLQFGCDDYLVTPANPSELQQVLTAPQIRLASESVDDSQSPEPIVTSAPSKIALLMGLPLAEIFLDAALKHPNDAPANVIKQLNAAIAPTMELFYIPQNGTEPHPPAGMMTMSAPVRAENDDLGVLYLAVPHEEEESASRHFLSQLAHLIGRVVALQDRHNRLQKLAITDDLTGLYNGRYFRHFLARILDRARTMRFPVTLLLFDIDNFKKYNDEFGHGVGDEILKQTATLMKRCCRDHDLVARISGDEFAVVFWEKEGPRQPREPKPGTVARLPQTPVQILERFRKNLENQDFTGLGPSGKGILTISGGLAVYPYDANDMESLIEAADKEMMFGAKKQGKNSIFLVGEQHSPPPAEPKSP